MKLARRLVLLLDGTWNEDAATDRDTNIVRIRDIIANGLTDWDTLWPRRVEDLDMDAGAFNVGGKVWDDTEYLFFYERGVGTGAGLDRLFGGGLGWGLSQNVRRAYRFLSRNYVPGTQIFIFGFSRGAYTARSLVGYLGSAGLLRAECCVPETEKEAWSYYRTTPNDRLPGIQQKLQRLTHPAEQLRIDCLGLFDTVGSLGIPSTIFNRFNRGRYEFHDVELSPIVKLNLHALAIDEHRLQFAASVWRYSKFRPYNSVTEQVWFPGAHTDVGGGYYSSENRHRRVRGADDVPLDWMLKRVHFHYPGFPVLDSARSTAFVPFLGKPKKIGVLHESRTWRYWMTTPAIRAIGNIRPPEIEGEVSASYDRSSFMVGESIHISALERLGLRAPFGDPVKRRLYVPRNLIEVLPNLHAKYCQNPKGTYGPDTLSVTDWTGDVVDPYEEGASLEDVQIALNAAVKRLKTIGYDIIPEQ